MESKKRKIILILTIVLSAILAISTVVGYAVIKHFAPVDTDENVINYEIIVEDEIKVYVGQDNYISPYLISDGGTVEVSRFDYAPSTDAISIGFDGLVTINSIPDGEVLVNISERNTGAQKQIKLHIIQSLESVLGLIAPDGDLIRGPQKLVVGNTYALSVVTEPKDFSIEQYCTVKVTDAAGTSKNVFDIDYDGGKILLTVFGIGKGKIDINVVNDDKESIYDANIEFESTMTDEPLNTKLLAQSGKTLLSKEELAGFETFIIDSAITDIASLKSLPNLKTVFIDCKEVLSFKNISSNYCYRVPEALFNSYYASSTWQSVKTNIIPCDEKFSGTYIVYHSDKVTELSFDKITPNYQLKTYTLTGYVNSSWNDSEGTRVLSRDVQAITENGIHVYAVWRPAEYNVVYHFRNFSVTVSDTWNYDESNAVRNIKSFDKPIEWTGYRFVGWTTDSSASVTTTEVTYKSDAICNNLRNGDGESIHLYDVWAPINYDIVFNMPEGTAAIQRMQVTYDSSYELPKSEKVGNDFNGWKTESGKTLSSGENTTNLTSTDGASVILTPIFDEIKYKIVFDFNGGTALNNSTFKDKTEIELSYSEQYQIPTLTKTGNTSYSWKCIETGTVYSSNHVLCKEFTTAGRRNFKAVWTSAVYTINYDCNGGTYNGKSTYTSGRYWNDGSQLLTPTRTGYTFAGWYDTVNGKTYLPGTAEWKSNLISSENEAGTTFNLRAKWTANTYVLTFNDNVTPKTKDVIFGSTYGSLPTPTKTGYTFAGWYVNGTKITSSTKVSTASNHTAEPSWTANKYTVTFNSDGGNALSAITVTYNSTYGTLPTPTKYGYNFDGWYLGSQKVIGSNKVTTTADHTLVARWTAKTTITVTFDPNGGYFSDSKDSSKSVIFGQAYGTLPTPVRESVSGTNGYTKYTFQGWYLDDVKITSESIVEKEDHTLKASWTSDWVPVEVDGGGGCLVEGTLITLADGTQKPVEKLSVDEDVIVFNHETGEYQTGKVWIILDGDKPRENYEVIYLTFSDGMVLRIADKHALFDSTLAKYVYLNASNAEEYIGHEFINLKQENGEYLAGKVTLVDVEVKLEYVKVYCPISATHVNVVANNMLTSNSGIANLDAIINTYAYDSNGKYLTEERIADIEKYGEYSYEEFAHLVSEKDYNSSPLRYLKVAVGKGLITREDIELFIIASVEMGYMEGP